MPQFIVGSSLVPLLEDLASPNFNKVALTGVGRGSELIGRSIRSDRYRYTQLGDSRKAAELYDYRTDPREHKNLVGNPAHADLLREMRAMFTRKVKSAVGEDLAGSVRLQRFRLRADTYRLEGDYLVQVKGGDPVHIKPGLLEGHMVAFQMDTERQTAATWGWAIDMQNEKPVDEIVVFLDKKNVYTGKPSEDRPDVSENHKNDKYKRSGFVLTLPVKMVKGAAEMRAFAISNGVASEVQYGEDARSE